MSNSDLRQYIKQFFSLTNEASQSQAAKFLKTKKVFEILRTGNQSCLSDDPENYVPNQSNIDGHAYVKTIVTNIIQIQQTKLKSYEKQDYFENNSNILKNYISMIGAFAKCELFIENFNYIFLLKEIIKSCKEDVKLYLSLRAQGDEKLVEGIISELRACFTTYNKNQSTEGILYS